MPESAPELPAPEGCAASAGSLALLEDLWLWAADQWHQAANESARWRDAGSPEMATRCEGKKAALAAVKKELLRRMSPENAGGMARELAALEPESTNQLDG